MKKRVLILDLDGTLYYHIFIKIFMGISLLSYYIFHIWKIKDIFLLLAYRKYREQNEKTNTEAQYKFIANKYKVSTHYVKKIVDKWLLKKPLNLIAQFKDKKLIKIINNCRKKGLKIFIYSDYPTDEKLKVMNINYDKSYNPGNKNIKYLKPNPKGLKYIIKENNLKKEEVLYIGDRDSKDGECARKCGIEYIILPKFFRKKYYLLIKAKVMRNRGVNCD